MRAGDFSFDFLMLDNTFLEVFSVRLLLRKEGNVVCLGGGSELCYEAGVMKLSFLQNCPATSPFRKK